TRRLTGAVRRQSWLARGSSAAEAGPGRHVVGVVLQGVRLQVLPEHLELGVVRDHDRASQVVTADAAPGRRDEVDVVPTDVAEVPAEVAHVTDLELVIH